MSKRPRLSDHLRLADPPAGNGPDVGTPRAATEAAPPPVRTADDLQRILTDAAADATSLTWLGWSRAWDVHLRLARFWLGMRDAP